MKDFKPNHTWPFHQYLETKDGVKVKIDMPVISSEFRTLDEALNNEENHRAFKTAVAINTKINLQEAILTL